MKKALALTMMGCGLAIQPISRTGAMVEVSAEGDFTCTPKQDQPTVGICCIKGDQGDRGEQGPKGDAGVNGEVGVKGVAGAAGLQGVTGLVGAVGKAGPTGEAGPQGDQGPDGDAGAKGETGAAGLKGPTGAEGKQGAAGAQGPVGDAGAAGPAGDEGTAGPAAATRVVPRVGVEAFPRWSSGTSCKSVTFSTAFASKPNVQASIGHNSYTGRGTHDATEGWVEDITTTGFKFCVSEILRASGKSQTYHHGTGAHDANCRVNYVAFDSSEPGTTSATAKYPKGFVASKSSPNCLDLAINPAAEDIVLSTLVHHGSNGVHQPTNVWGENVKDGKMRFCAREPQKYDQKHWGESIDVVSISALPKVIGAQGGNVKMTGFKKNAATCQTVSFVHKFDAAPAVVIAADHRPYTGTGTHDETLYWVEGVTVDGFRVCAREADDHDGPHDGNIQISYLAAKPTSALSFIEIQSNTPSSSTSTVDLTQAQANNVMCPDGQWKGDVGPAGPAGPQGDSGNAGDKGAAGDQGSPGTKGLTGAKGATGPAGEQGAPGAAGAVGSKGAAGETGDAGEVGAQGDAGPAGPAGAAGPVGAEGAKGAVGPKGPTGAPGPAGQASLLEVARARIASKIRALNSNFVTLEFYKGAKGAQGPPGKKGPKGATGAQGAQGDAGAVGDTGAAGDQGEQGEQGPRGPVGAKGATGEKGSSGDQGPAGPQGATGAAGPQGAEGPVGAAGAKGATGAVGDKGPKGDVGDQGQNN